MPRSDAPSVLPQPGRTVEEAGVAGAQAVAHLPVVEQRRHRVPSSDEFRRAVRSRPEAARDRPTTDPFRRAGPGNSLPNTGRASTPVVNRFNDSAELKAHPRARVRRAMADRDRPGCAGPAGRRRRRTASHWKAIWQRVAGEQERRGLSGRQETAVLREATPPNSEKPRECCRCACRGRRASAAERMARAREGRRGDIEGRDRFAQERAYGEVLPGRSGGGIDNGSRAAVSGRKYAPSRASSTSASHARSASRSRAFAVRASTIRSESGVRIHGSFTKTRLQGSRFISTSNGPDSTSRRQPFSSAVTSPGRWRKKIARPQRDVCFSAPQCSIDPASSSTPTPRGRRPEQAAADGQGVSAIETQKDLHQAELHLEGSSRPVAMKFSSAAARATGRDRDPTPVQGTSPQRLKALRQERMQKNESCVGNGRCETGIDADRIVRRLVIRACRAGSRSRTRPSTGAVRTPCLISASTSRARGLVRSRACRRSVGSRDKAVTPGIGSGIAFAESFGGTRCDTTSRSRWSRAPHAAQNQCLARSLRTFPSGGAPCRRQPRSRPASPSRRSAEAAGTSPLRARGTRGPPNQHGRNGLRRRMPVFGERRDDGDRPAAKAIARCPSSGTPATRHRRSAASNSRSRRRRSAIDCAASADRISGAVRALTSRRRTDNASPTRCCRLRSASSHRPRDTNDEPIDSDHLVAGRQRSNAPASASAGRRPSASEASAGWPTRRRNSRRARPSAACARDASRRPLPSESPRPEHTIDDGSSLGLRRGAVLAPLSSVLTVVSAVRFVTRVSASATVVIATRPSLPAVTSMRLPRHSSWFR